MLVRVNTSVESDIQGPGWSTSFSQAGDEHGRFSALLPDLPSGVQFGTVRQLESGLYQSGLVGKLVYLVGGSEA